MKSGDKVQIISPHVLAGAKARVVCFDHAKIQDRLVLVRFHKRVPIKEGNDYCFAWVKESEIAPAQSLFDKFMTRFRKGT